MADFKSPFAGEYKSNDVELGVTGPLGLFSSTCALPAKFEYSVYPRTLGVAVTSAKLLGMGGVGDIPVERVGIGTEFYDIREYQPGDDFRQINWKATARRGDLMTNEHMREVGGACYIVLEAVAPDYFDRDRLAAAFLGIANALTMQGTAFGIMVHDGERVKQIKRIDAPTASLAFALKVALEFADLDTDRFPRRACCQVEPFVEIGSQIPDRRWFRGALSNRGLCNIGEADTRRKSEFGAVNPGADPGKPQRPTGNTVREWHVRLCGVRHRIGNVG